MSLIHCVRCQVKLAVTDELTVEMQLTQHAPNQYGIDYDGNSYCISASIDAEGNMQAKVDDRHLEARLVHSDNGVHVSLALLPVLHAAREFVGMLL